MLNYTIEERDKMIGFNINDEEECLEAVRENAYAIQFIKDQTEAICLEAVKQDGLTLRFVNNQVE